MHAFERGEALAQSFDRERVEGRERVEIQGRAHRAGVPGRRSVETRRTVPVPFYLPSIALDRHDVHLPQRVRCRIHATNGSGAPELPPTVARPRGTA
jgi:hypothetical protein